MYVYYRLVLHVGMSQSLSYNLRSFNCNVSLITLENSRPEQRNSNGRKTKWHNTRVFPLVLLCFRSRQVAEEKFAQVEENDRRRAIPSNKRIKFSRVGLFCLQTKDLSWMTACQNLKYAIKMRWKTEIRPTWFITCGTAKIKVSTQ